MKRIGIYFFCVVAIGCLTSSILYRESEKMNEIRLEKSAQNEASEIKEESAAQTMENLVAISDSEQAKGRYLVKEEEGYLVIYDGVTMKRYDETTIRIEDLPERLQVEVTEGLYFLDEEGLYAFLENYSS
ncbi:MAG: hypothetical protein IJZ23_06000 [Roseburia sp.]|nr:hypothetical protein [Roseburia sp.]